MIAAIAQHVWLLMTMRHNLTGLPSKSFWLMFALLTASAAVAGVRWDGIGFAYGHLVLMIALGGFVGPRAVSALCLLSLGVDLIAIPVEYLTEQRDLMIFNVWQLAAMVVITIRGIGQ